MPPVNNQPLATRAIVAWWNGKPTSTAVASFSHPLIPMPMLRSRAMKYAVLLALCALMLGCGYRVVSWSSTYQTLDVRAPNVVDGTRDLGPRMQDILVERCLAASALQPAGAYSDLSLTTTLHAYRENVIATGIDGRTSRIQFDLRASFRLQDRAGKQLWALQNYRYSDQYEVSTLQTTYRDEAVFVQDQALRAMADLVITNITLVVSELGKNP